MIGDIMSAKSAGGADELNAQLQIRKGIKNARQIRKDGAKSVARMRTDRPILRYLLLWNPLTANLLSSCYCVTLYPC
jgi:hypothetical protein